MRALDVEGHGGGVGARALERVCVIDASIRQHDGSGREMCGECGLPMAPGNVIELTLRSTRPAQVRARLHPACAVRFLDSAEIDLAGTRTARVRRDTARPSRAN